jgi:sulfite exporter TauE/SafE/plastocyanin domain-containing protein/copper chaperone CopZ
MKPKRQQLILKVRGMTCAACERHVSEAAAGLPGVAAAKADQARGRLTIDYDPDTTGRAALAEAASAAVAEVGYAVTGTVHAAGQARVLPSVALGLGLVGLFLVMNGLGWFNYLPTIDSTVGLGMVFVAGLLTSLHCVAMCGGIALSQSQPAPVEPGAPAAGRWSAATRGAQYHLGRVVAYTLLGGIVGALGSVLSLSPLGKGLVAAVAGVFMVLMGLRMVGLLPRLGRFRPLGRLGGALRRLLPSRGIAALRGKGPFFVGLLNGLMPCGPLQSMQLYALGTGSALLGAASMFLFSLGTVPLLYAFGSFAGLLRQSWRLRLVQAGAVLVVFFGLAMAGRALEFTGAGGQVRAMMASAMAAVHSGQSDAPAGVLAVGASGEDVRGGNGSGGKDAPAGRPSTTAYVKDGVQYVSFDLQRSAYAPITIQKGLPVRWTINATAATLNGCNGTVTVPQLGLRKKLQVGANLIEFTAPAAAGALGYTCWMGMISSTINVVDKLPEAPAASPAPPAKSGVSASDAPDGGAVAAIGATCACCSPPAGAGVSGIPTASVAKAVFRTEDGKKIQEITVKVGANGYEPSVVLVEKGVPARFRFAVGQLSACNRYVDFPDYGGGLDLAGAQTATPLLPVERDFTFRCGMDMLRAYVQVVDDLGRADPSAARAAAAAWKPTGGSGGMASRGS